MQLGFQTIPQMYKFAKMSAIMKPFLCLAILSILNSGLIMTQNVPTLSCSNHPTFVIYQRVYIQAINRITSNTMFSLGATKPALQPLAIALNHSLAVNPSLASTGITFEILSQPTSTTGKSLKMLARTLDSMINQWNVTGARFWKQNQANITTFIATVNQITSSVFTDFGRQYPRLQHITNAFSFAFTFSPITMRGSSLFNHNQSITTTGEALKLFSAKLTEMVNKWGKAESSYFELKKRFC